MKKLFGGLNLTWPKIIIAALIIGPIVGLLNSVYALLNTSLTDPAIYFSFWILCGILIIMNSKSNLDSALKCFVFFLISQPLIYLVEVPFNDLGWGIFVYYKPWFIWTVFCLPMGFIGYYMKKDKWWGLLILLPMMFLLLNEMMGYLSGVIYSFPKHLLSYLFSIASLIIYPLYIFKNKKIRIIGLIISILGIVSLSLLTLIDKPVYETEIACNGGRLGLNMDDTYKAYLNDKAYGELEVRRIESLDDYCLHAKFTKEGETDFTVEDGEGNKKEYHIVIKRSSYKITDKENSTES